LHRSKKAAARYIPPGGLTEDQKREKERLRSRQRRKDNKAKGIKDRQTWGPKAAAAAMRIPGTPD